MSDTDANIEALIHELQEMIVDTLELEEMTPEELDPDRALFGEAGVGLDSIDAMELGVALKRRYHVSIGADTKGVEEYFSNVRSMAKFVAANRKD